MSVPTCSLPREIVARRMMAGVAVCESHQSRAENRRGGKASQGGVRQHEDTKKVAGVFADVATRLGLRAGLFVTWALCRRCPRVGSKAEPQGY